MYHVLSRQTCLVFAFTSGHTDSGLVGCLLRPEDPRVPSVLCPGVSKKFANFLRPTSRRFSRTSRGSLSLVTLPRWRVDKPRCLPESLIFFHRHAGVFTRHASGSSTPTWQAGPWSDRGHHVPALTATSGGRGVGFDIACCNVLQQSGSFSGHERGLASKEECRPVSRTSCKVPKFR